MLETSILEFEAANCDVIQLNLKEFVFGLVALYLGGGLVGIINIFVGVCVWRQDKTQPWDSPRNGELTIRKKRLENRTIIAKLVKIFPENNKSETPK